MITKMKKVAFLVYHKEYEEFLASVRDIGVVHIEERERVDIKSTPLNDKLDLATRLKTNIKFLSTQMLSKDLQKSNDFDQLDSAELLSKVEECRKLRDEYKQELAALVRTRDQLKPWGDFKKESINRLGDAGFFLNFFIVPKARYNKEWEEKFNALQINEVGSLLYFVTVTKSAQVEIDAEPIKLPSKSLSEYNSAIQKMEQATVKNEKTIEQLAAYHTGKLEEYLLSLDNTISFERILLNTEEAVNGQLRVLEGWIPIDKEGKLIAFLQEKGVYYEIRDPQPEDDVPILLKNKGLFAWFEPICKLYMLPKYNELDLTPFFAPFFMIFFGLCLGDSGYGLFLFIGATLYGQFAKNLPDSMKPILSLVKTLGASAFFCGLLTGGFFGAQLYDLDWAIVQRLKRVAYLDNNEMFSLSLILGVIQVLFGMILKSVNLTIQLGFKYAVSTIGWIVLLISTLVAVALPNVLPMSGYLYQGIIIASALTIYLYNSPGKNIFLNLGLGLWDTYNMATGLLGDILSYVRLFALGLSGGILATVFNSLATGMSPDNAVLGPIVTVLIFVIGHSINIFMNTLGALVHPMRLTFVEFFKNSGYEGGGRLYQNFKKTTR